MKRLEKELESAKEKIPIHFMDDSFFTICFSSLIQNVVISGQVLVLYRVDPDSISHKSEISNYVIIQDVLCYTFIHSMSLRL